MPSGAEGGVKKKRARVAFLLTGPVALCHIAIDMKRAVNIYQLTRTRKSAKLTQQQAADLLSVHLRSWQRWEYGEVEMPPAMWELWQIKTEGMR